MPAGGTRISNSHVPSTCRALPGSPGSSRHRPLSDTQATRRQGHCSLKGLSRSDTAQGSFGGPRWGPGQLPALLGTHAEASSGETQLLSVGLRKVQLSMPSQTACPAGTLTPARPHPWRLRCRKLQPHALCSSTLWRGPRRRVGWGGDGQSQVDLRSEGAAPRAQDSGPLLRVPSPENHLHQMAGSTHSGPASQAVGPWSS